MNFYTLCITTAGHDASIALFNNDDLILFSQGERHTRVKNDDDINAQIFEYIKNNITETIDLLIVHPVGQHIHNIYINITETFNCKKIIRQELVKHYNRVVMTEDKNFSHHITHALSAFYMSPFEDAVCLVVDALGSPFQLRKHHDVGIMGNETTTIVEINKNYDKKLLYKKVQYVPAVRAGLYRVGGADDADLLMFNFAGGLFDDGSFIKNVPFHVDLTPHMDIGNMYHTISMHLDFGSHGCGKVMGLSAYGDPNNKLPPFLFGDTTYANGNLFSIDRTIDRNCYPELYEDTSFQNFADMAYNVQRAIEKVFVSHAEFIKNNSNTKNLIIAGGCALNILGVSAIKEKYPEFNIFVDPIAHDATNSIGLGIHCYKHYHDATVTKKANSRSIYLGPEYQLSEISNQVDELIDLYNSSVL